MNLEKQLFTRNRKRIQKSLWLLPLGLGLFLSGCNANTDQRAYVTENGETTVVLSKTEGIFPKEGVALHKVAIDHYRGYDFLSNDTLVGYQFSKTVFGDDRGLWRFNLKEGKLADRLNLEESPKLVRVSKDKTQMVIMPEQTGGGKSLLLMDMKEQDIRTFEAVRNNYLWSFNWQFDGEGLTGFDVDDKVTKIWRIQPDATLKAYEIKHEISSYLDLENIQGTKKNLYYTVMGERSGLYKYDWESQKTTAISEGHFIKQLKLSPDESRLAMVDFKNNDDQQSLSIYGTDGKKHYEVFKGSGIDQVIWQPDGKALAFTAVDATGLMSLYHANLTDGQLQFLGEYPSYSVESLAFSPNSAKLLVSFEDKKSKDSKWITHILTLTEGGTNYE